MTRLLCVTVMLALSGISGVRAQTDADRSSEAMRILEQADGYRSPWPSMVVRTRIDNYDGDRLKESAEFEVALKGDNSLVKFLSARTKGQSLLMRGDDLWFYLPSVARPVRITPVQRLLGNTANGDLARLRYAIDYTPSIEGMETIDGTPAVILNLQAKRKGATYQRIRYAVRQRDSMPLRAEFFLTSGRHLKTAYFDSPRMFAGRELVSRIVILDDLNLKSKTVMVFTDFVPTALNDKIFNPARGES